MKIVVTGGAGFIGAHLCRALLERSDVKRVTVIDDLSTGAVANLGDLPIDLIEADILDVSMLNVAVKDAHAVVHLAAKASVPESIVDPRLYHEANVTGTINVLEACRRTRTPVVIASSSSVYGENDVAQIHEGLPAKPLSPYAASKLSAEAHAQAYSASYGLPVLVLRFFNVYGPFQSANHPYAAVIPSFINAAIQGNPLRIYGNGRQTRDFVYAGSVGKVLADAAVGQVASVEPVNLASGRRTSLLELAECVMSLVREDAEIWFSAARPGDIRDSHASISRLKRLMPSYTDVPLREGLKQTVEWYCSLPEISSNRALSHAASA